MDRETGRPRGFAFVEYDDRAHAEEAIRRFNNQPLGGRNLAVNEARPQERSSGPAPYRSGSSSYSARPARPDSGGPGGGYDRPRPPAGPRPGGFVSDAPPEEMGGRSARDRSRNFGPDAPARKKRKGDRKSFDRGPKKPLPITSGGRFFSGDEDDDDGDLSDLDALFATDDEGAELVDGEVEEVDEDLDEEQTSENRNAEEGEN